MQKGPDPETGNLARSRQADGAPALESARMPSPEPPAAPQPAAELSASSFKFKLEPSQKREASSLFRNSPSESLNASVGPQITVERLPKFSRALLKARSKVPWRGFFGFRTGRTILDGMLNFLAGLLKLLEKLLFFLFGKRTPGTPRPSAPATVIKQEDDPAVPVQKKKEKGRTAAME